MCNRKPKSAPPCVIHNPHEAEALQLAELFIFIFHSRKDMMKNEVSFERTVSETHSPSVMLSP